MLILFDTASAQTVLKLTNSVYFSYKFQSIIVLHNEEKYPSLMSTVAFWSLLIFPSRYSGMKHTIFIKTECSHYLTIKKQKA